MQDTGRARSDGSTGGGTGGGTGGVGSAGAGTVVVLGLLSMFGPLSLDLYLPVLPQLAGDLGASASQAQLTITACLVGLAVGQVVAGPLSDRYGRRRPLLVGLALYVVASLACALAPGILTLVAVRLVQGLAGAAGIVIARAVARDLASGRALLVLFSRLALVSGLAPVLAPVVGGQLARVTSWRGIFIVLTALGVVLLVAGAVGVRESLPAGRRTDGGLGATLRGLGALLRDSGFTGVVLTSGLASASMFAYIAGATFVLQELHGLSPAQFSLAFGTNALGIVTLTQVGGVLGRRGWPAGRLLPVGLTLNVTGALLLLVAVLFDLPLPVLLVALFVMVSALGLVFPTATTLALAEHPERAGAASSLLGLGQFVLGGLVAPLVGLAGEGTAVPLGVVAAACSLAAVLVYGVVARPRLRRTTLAAAGSGAGPTAPAPAADSPA